MKDSEQLKVIFNNMNLKMKLLEGLEWDETKLNNLLDYLGEKFNDEIVSHPSVIVEHVKKNFGLNISLVLSEIFKKEIFKNNFHLEGAEIEH